MISAEELIEKAGLTPREVHCLINYYYENYFEREIAEQLKISRPSVSVALTSAKQKLSKAGFPVPRRLPRPSEAYFDPDKLDTLEARAGGFYSWTDSHKG